jgi:DNA-binding beta-propeller fold protein YncE
MKRAFTPYLLVLCAFAGAALHSQQPAASTEVPSSPFLIKSTWIIGGAGSWDYLTMDPGAERLYIAHGHRVQVVDVKTGTLAGEISGLGEAHDIALDDIGEFGYISDGLGGKVVVFDRRTLQTVASIDGIPSPRSLVFEPQTRLLFAVRTDPAPTPRAPSVPRTTTHIVPRPAPAPQPAPRLDVTSTIMVIDTQTRKVVGQILLPEALGFAQADGRGDLFVNAPDRNRILRFDAQTVASLLPGKPEGNAKPSAPPFVIDWTQRGGQVHSFSLDGQCATPKSLAVDSAHSRLFAACDNLKLFVLNADSGELMASLPIGPGVDAIGYDAGRGLIYAASGGADGSLIIISQSVTDGYAVIQTLPTRQRARTLAVNPENGQIYLVTDLLGVNLAQTGGIGTLRTDPVNGSFEVLVVGH